MFRRACAICVWAVGIWAALCGIAAGAGAEPAEDAPGEVETPNPAVSLQAAPLELPPRVSERAAIAATGNSAATDLRLPPKPTAPPAFKLAASRVRVIEMPGEVSPFGAKRPHHAIGLRSHWAENWLREQGMPVNNCLLPMLRLHSRVAPSGSANATLWVYARCSLH